MTAILAKNRCLLRPLANDLFRFRQAASLLAKYNRHVPNEQAKEPEKDVNHQLSEKSYLANQKALTKRFNIGQADDLSQASVKDFLKRHRELGKSQKEPMHLTILDERKADQIAQNLLSQTLRNDSCERLFIDLQPGACLVSKHLIKSLLARFNVDGKAGKLTDTRLVLIEPLSKYSTYLDHLKATYGDQVQIETFKARPFEFDFMYTASSKAREIAKSIKRQKKTSDTNHQNKQCVFFGILPWNRLGFMTKLFNNYAGDQCFFSLRASDDEPHEFFFYIPELVLAKLMPERDERYSPFRSALSIYASQFLKTLEIVKTSSADDFYPYPIMKTPHKFSKHPYDQLDFSQMHLVRMVFKARDEELNFATRFSDRESHDLAPVPMKYLFYLFVQEIYQRPKYTLIKVLKDVFKVGKQSKKPSELGMKDHEYIAKMCSEIGINSYSLIKKLGPHQCLSVFNTIISDPKTSTFLDYLISRGKNVPKTEREIRNSGIKRQTYLKALLVSNQQMKGQLKLPTIVGSEAA